MGAHSESAQVNALLHEIVPLIHKCPSMNADDARSAMYGLQGLHATSKEANAIFDAFADLLIRSRIVFRTPAEVSTALYGLQGLSSTDSPETRKLVGTITKLISEEPIRGTFSSRELSMSFYGLRASSSSSSDTRKILSVLTPEIHKFRGQLSCQDIASCLYGLQKLSSNSDEVVAAVGALAQHIPDASGKFNPKGLSMALNGLQGLSSKLPEVRQLVAGLKILLERTEPTFNGFDDFHQISSALFGLGNLRSEHVEVRELLEVVDRLLHRQAIRVGKGNTVVQTRHKLKIGEIPKPEKMGMALFGMQVRTFFNSITIFYVSCH